MYFTFHKTIGYVWNDEHDEHNEDNDDIENYDGYKYHHWGVQINTKNME